MGLLDFFRRKAVSAPPGVLEAWNGGVSPYPKLGGTNQRVNEAWMAAQAASYGHIYSSQPAVRMVVDFIARNASQLGLKLYKRVTDTDREQNRDHPAAETMAYPNSLEPADKFLHCLISDYLVDDNAYALKMRPTPGSPLMLMRIPPQLVGVNSDRRYTQLTYTIHLLDGTSLPPVPAEDLIHWHGYNPNDSRFGLSRLHTLREILAEDAAAQTAQVELMKGGLLKRGIIERPIEAPEWSAEDRERFIELWRNTMQMAGARGTPILDEGMTFSDLGVSPKDAEMLDGRRFTIEEVCRIYGVLPAALGIGNGDSEKATKRFYADVLAPLSKELALQLDFSLLRQEWGDLKHYFEFDLNEKLRGDLETRTSAFIRAVGRPYMTPNEVRAKENLPPVEGGDELTVPLNVVVGDNPRPAPNVMPPQDPNKPSQDGDARETSSLNGKGTMLEDNMKPLVPRRARAYERRNRWARDEYEPVLVRHFDRQKQQIKSAKGMKLGKRADDELASDLAKTSRRHFEAEGKKAAARMAAGFDDTRGQNWLEAKARGAAEGINRVTQEHIDADGVDAAIALAKEKRAVDAGKEYATSVAAFAVRVAAEEADGSRTVTIDGGECNICAEYQGVWPADQVPAWPAYHPSCDCVCDPS